MLNFLLPLLLVAVVAILLWMLIPIVYRAWRDG